MIKKKYYFILFLLQIYLKTIVRGFACWRKFKWMENKSIYNVIPAAKYYWCPKNSNYSWFYQIVIKNVSSSTTHKKTPSLCLSVFPSLCLSFWEFKKILPNAFIYESILIKNYMNTNIMNMQIFHFKKYDLKGHWRS